MSRSDMKSQKHPQAGGLVAYAFLSRKEMLLFRQLTHGRRPLPVYRAGCWVCYECPFESTDRATTARHIVGAHEVIPVSEDDSDEDDSDLAD